MDITNKKKWLLERQKGLGGTDIAGIIGASKFSTPLSVWKSKLEPIKDIDNNYMATGRKLEQFIGRWFAQENNKDFIAANQSVPKGKAGVGVVYNPSKELIVSRENDIFRASCDFFYDINGVLECKSTSRDIEYVDEAHYCQGQWYLGVTGRKELTVSYAILPYKFDYDKFLASEWVDIDVLRSALQYKEFTFEADKDFIEYMQHKADKFWRQHVLTGIPPAPTNEDDVKYLFPKSVAGSKIEIEPSILPLVDMMTKAKKKLEESKEEYEQLSGQFKAIMRDAEIAEYNGKVVATYKSSKDGETFDKTAFVEKHGELYNKFLKPKKGARVFLLKG